MKKAILIATAVLLFCPSFAFSETVSLSTYYPAPYGTYDRIRLVPRPQIVGACRVGTMYTDADNGNILRYCRDNLLGPDNGTWGPIPEIWERDMANDNIYLTDGELVPALQVGIGDASPDAALEVSDSGQGNPVLMLSSDDNNDGDLMTVDSTGNVGLGTNAPAAAIDLTDNTRDIRIYSGNGTAHILGDEASGEVNGIVLRTTADPAAGEPIFVVESAAGTQRLRVEHSGALKTANEIEVDGAGDSYVVGNLTVGGTTPPASPQPVNIDGGIMLRDDGTNWGRLQLQYSGGNYYAVYAP